MKHKTGNTPRIFLAFFIMAVLIILGGLSSAGAADSKATFTVQWYDVGKDALDGLKGVKKVEKGFRGSNEINTVYYDSEVITIEEMEAALKDAGTYIGVEKWH